MYVVKYDTTAFFGNGDTIIAPHKLYFTKLKTNKLLDYKSVNQSQESLFNLYPNPITDRTLLDYRGPKLDDIEITIYDMIGNKLSQQNISFIFNYSQFPIRLENYPSGIYHLLIHHQGEEIWQTQLMKVQSK